jgi:hypothetical protein
LAAVSTAKDHSNEWVQQVAVQLWQHLETAWADLDVTSLPDTAINTGAKLVVLDDQDLSPHQEWVEDCHLARLQS